VASTGTTALCAIYGLKQTLAIGDRVDAASLIGAITPPDPYGGGVTNCSVAEYNQAVAVVAAELAADLDPLASIARDPASGTFYRRFAAVGLLAPDDRGDANQTHDYLVTKTGITSTFVWIPTFVAYLRFE